MFLFRADVILSFISNMVLFTNFYVRSIAENYIAACIAKDIHQWIPKLSGVTLLFIVKI